MFWFVPCAFFSTNNFARAQMLYRMRSLCRSYECMNIVWVNIGFFTGFKKIKQWRISFVLGYLRIIVCKISTAISIKHRILTFNIKKKFNSDSLYAFKILIRHFDKSMIEFSIEVCMVLFSFSYTPIRYWILLMLCQLKK